jgi:hypothetical protein
MDNGRRLEPDETNFGGRGAVDVVSGLTVASSVPDSIPTNSLGKLAYRSHVEHRRKNPGAERIRTSYHSQTE